MAKEERRPLSVFPTKPIILTAGEGREIERGTGQAEFCVVNSQLNHTATAGHHVYAQSAQWNSRRRDDRAFALQWIGYIRSAGRRCRNGLYGRLSDVRQFVSGETR